MSFVEAAIRLVALAYLPSWRLIQSWQSPQWRMGLQNTMYSPSAIDGAQKTFSTKIVLSLASVISYFLKYSSGWDINDQKRTPAALAKFNQTTRSLSATLAVM